MNKVTSPQLKRWKMDNLEQVDDDELENIIERAREMEDHYGHYFDMIIIYRCITCVTFPSLCRHRDKLFEKRV